VVGRSKVALRYLTSGSLRVARPEDHRFASQRRSCVPTIDGIIGARSTLIRDRANVAAVPLAIPHPRHRVAVPSQQAYGEACRIDRLAKRSHERLQLSLDPHLSPGQQILRPLHRMPQGIHATRLPSKRDQLPAGLCYLNSLLCQFRDEGHAQYGRPCRCPSSAFDMTPAVETASSVWIWRVHKLVSPVGHRATSREYSSGERPLERQTDSHAPPS